jgi:hypothetical protein
MTALLEGVESLFVFHDKFCILATIGFAVAGGACYLIALWRIL